jgi:hypothetical protein
MMKIVLAMTLIFMSLVLSGCSSSASMSLPKIVNGHPAEQGSLLQRHTVGLLIAGKTCTGTLIDQDWVLTAAHCVHGSTSADIKVVFDSILNAPTGKIVPASEVVTLHREGAAFFPHFDLALVKLGSSAPQTHLPVPLFSEPHKLNAGQSLIIAGYGTVGRDCPVGGLCSGILNEGQTSFYRLYQQPHAMNLIVTKNQGIQNIASPCFGDSGGPLFLDVEGQLRLIGIASGATLLHTPYAFVNKTKVDCQQGWGLYTFPGHYLAWITQVIHQNKLDSFFPSQEKGLSRTETKLRPNGWIQWLNADEVGTEAWYSFDYILGRIAAMPNVHSSEIEKFFDDASITESLALNMKSLTIKFSDNPDLSRPLRDLSPFTTLQGLERLNLVKTDVEDLTPLARLPHLQSLSLACSKSRSNHFLASLDSFLFDLNASLRNLSLIDCSLQNLMPIDWSPAASLEELTIAGSNDRSADIANIRYPINLRRLFLYNHELRAQLQLPPNLQVLALDGIQIKEVNGQWIKPGPLCRIASLTLENASLTNLEQLIPRQCQHIQELILKNANLEVLNGLQSFPIRTLDVSQNPRLFSIGELPKTLMSLKITNTSITVDEVARIKESHPELLIVGP